MTAKKDAVTEEMVTEQMPEKTQPYMEELVEYIAPLTTPDAKPIFAGVNGETIRFQRGVPVMIKRKYLEVLRHAQEQEREAYFAQKRAMEDSTKALADL